MEWSPFLTFLAFVRHHHRKGTRDDVDADADADVSGTSCLVLSPAATRGCLVCALLCPPKQSFSSAPFLRKFVAKRQGSTAASIVMAKTEDLVAKACWKKGEPVPFKAIAEVFDRVEQTTKR